MAIPMMYQTNVMSLAIEHLPISPTFLKDRYFPTDETNDMFPGENVLVEMRKGNRKIAPFVVPKKKGILVEREGYSATMYTPPFIAPQRTLGIDELEKKQFGEALFGDMSQKQREEKILAQDLEDLSLMSNRAEEFYAAELMQNNEVSLKHYTDQYGSDEYDEFICKFYKGNNESIYTVSTPWTTAGAPIMGDISAMVTKLTDFGNEAIDIITSPFVGNLIMQDDVFLKLLDNRGVNIGEIDPREFGTGVGHLGEFIAAGFKLNIFTYNGKYEDVDGKIKSYIDENSLIITAPGAGRGMYGAVTQLESDKEGFQIYPGRRVPKFTSDVESDIRTLKLTSRPFLAPNSPNPWICAKVFDI